MVNVAQVEAFPVLPEEATSDVPNGKYVVATTDEVIHEAEDDQIVYQPWLKTHALDNDTIERIQSVQLLAESHDQGFCDEPEKGNWTWFEVAIMENEEAESPRVKDGIELTWVSHKNRFTELEYGWKSGKTFPATHDMFRLLEDGNVICVRLCARFGSWQIFARTGYLVIELGNITPRKPLDYGSVVVNVQAVQEVFQDVNSTLLVDSLPLPAIPDGLFRAEMINSSNNRPLRVLSLDGGGVRGIAALMLLKAVMEKAAPTKKPCEVFDIIGGTSTGGFIAIMLGRLRMSVDDCIRKYEEFMKVVFPSKYGWKKKVDLAYSGAQWNASDLEKVIKSVIRETLGKNPDEVLLLDEESEKSSCKVFVTAVNQTGSNNHAPVLLRSYTNPLEKSELPTIKLWEAARATSAAPSYFTPLTVKGPKLEGREPDTCTFMDGGLQANNPLGWLWNEVLSVYGPARNTSCILSIGTGVPLSKTVSGVRNVLGFAQDMAGIATNTEVTNILFRSLINAFAPHPMAKKYWRFNVGDGLPDWVEEDGVWQWKLLGERQEENRGELDDIAAIPVTKRQAEEYLNLQAAKNMVAECAACLKP